MNPNDVFPRRNLPPDAEDWGRRVEGRIRAVEFAAITNKQKSSGQNRNNASTLQDIARQVEDLSALYASIPKPLQASVQTSNFGLSAGWNTVATATMTVPDDVSRVNLLAVGSGHLVSTTTTTTVASSSRLNFTAVGASPTIPGAWFTGAGDYRTVMVPTYSWFAAVTPGSTLTVQFQVNPADASAYGPNADSYAVLSLMATFTG